MTHRLISCDCSGGLMRAAVWRSKDLTDIYLDSRDNPDMTGAVVCGKILRLDPRQGKAWVDAGLAETIYIEKAAAYHSGDMITLRIQTTMVQGKAWVGKVVKEGKDNPPLGVIVPPPSVWQRALADVPAGTSVTIHFARAEDEKVFQALAPKGVKAVLCPREPVHPDLDDKLAALRDPLVPLRQAGHLVIQPTEALVVIDINGGAAKNPLDINLRAAHEIARQIRLRNLSGIIVVDALKSTARSDGAKMVEVLRRASIDDPAGVQVHGITKLGLIEITRTRRGPALHEMKET